MSNYRGLKVGSGEWCCGAPKVVRPPDLSLTGAGGRRAAGEAGGRCVQLVAGQCLACLLKPFSDIQCEEVEVVVEVVEPGRWWHFLEQPTLHQLIASWSLPAPLLPTATARTLSSSSYWHHSGIISASYHHNIVIISSPYHHNTVII